MTAREYLSQAYRLDERINSKIQQVDSLNALAAKCTSTITGMPKSQNGSASRMEDIVVKIIDLENEISEDIDRLVDLKAEIVGVIKQIDNEEQQAILEERYLCFRTWKQIASDFGYNVRHLYRIHDEALKKIVVPTKVVTQKH